MKNLKNALLLKHLYSLKELGYRYTSLKPYKIEEPNLAIPNSMDSIKERATNCELCKLSQHRKRVVWGEGNPNATVMFVGDAPSNSDENIGKVFTSRAGETLNKMIVNVLGLQREAVYLTNVLKCRPIDTINPSPTYAHTCHPYLLKEIESVKPKIVVAFGDMAYYYLTGDDRSISQARGEYYQKDDYIVVPTYHPNYLLRNSSYRGDVFKDLKLVKSLL